MLTAGTSALLLGGLALFLYYNQQKGLFGMYMTPRHGVRDSSGTRYYDAQTVNKRQSHLFEGLTWYYPNREIAKDRVSSPWAYHGNANIGGPPAWPK
jgi:hypothetical protein